MIVNNYKIAFGTQLKEEEELNMLIAKNWILEKKKPGKEFVFKNRGLYEILRQG